MASYFTIRIFLCYLDPSNQRKCNIQTYGTAVPLSEFPDETDCKEVIEAKIMAAFRQSAGFVKHPEGRRLSAPGNR
jgi:hypothetical protein